MCSDVLVQHSNVQQCQSARNFLVKKLDFSVVILPISCHCSSIIKEQSRYTCCCVCMSKYVHLWYNPEEQLKYMYVQSRESDP